MDDMRFRWKITGKGAGGATFECGGELESPFGGFVLMMADAIRGTFGQLTEGKAVYGQPGVGCDGPYTIDNIAFERVRPS